MEKTLDSVPVTLPPAAPLQSRVTTHSLLSSGDRLCIEAEKERFPFSPKVPYTSSLFRAFEIFLVALTRNSILGVQLGRGPIVNNWDPIVASLQTDLSKAISDSLTGRTEFSSHKRN